MLCTHDAFVGEAVSLFFSGDSSGIPGYHSPWCVHFQSHLEPKERGMEFANQSRWYTETMEHPLSVRYVSMSNLSFR